MTYSPRNTPSSLIVYVSILFGVFERSLPYDQSFGGSSDKSQPLLRSQVVIIQHSVLAETPTKSVETVTWGHRFA